MPETPWAVTLGRTTQNLASASRKCATSLSMRAVTMTLLEVRGEVDLLDHADLHVAEAHRGLAGLDAGGVVEDDLDQRPALGIGAPGDAERDDEASERHQPDRARCRERLRRSAPRPRGRRLGLRHAARSPGSALSQIRRGSRACAESMVKATESAKKTAAGPGFIETMKPSWTSAVRMATTKTSIIDQRPMNSTTS